GCSVSINMRARASGSPAATQRSQNPDTMSVSGVPERPASASHADNSAKKASFTPRLYSHNVRLWQSAPKARITNRLPSGELSIDTVADERLVRALVRSKN